MNQQDTYYRAYRALRAALAAQRECAAATHAFAETGETEAVAVTRVVCTVDEAWIRAIEEGLVHIEKAIKEERQFIHSRGEVVPIEKVRHVSKDSVSHLARHAELITRVNEGEDLIPDKIYTVERLSDYAVYENRFLYMLLCYLRDFVSLRFRQIWDLTHRYEGRLSLEKEVTHGGRQVQLKVELSETRRDDEYLRDHNAAADLIDRMDLILKTVSAFLATPLMESAGKVAMLKPPITKTNILKMDNNFKGAVALYDYIIAYDGPGYTVEEQVTELSPFPAGMAEDMADAQLLLSFLTYRYGLSMGEDLKAAYDAEEARARRAELKDRTERMEALRRRLEREGEPPEAYILVLEQQVRALQHETDRHDAVYHELAERRALCLHQTEVIDHLTARVRGFDEKMADLEQAHATAVEEMERAHATAVEEMEQGHAAAMEEMEQAHCRALLEEREREAAEALARGREEAARDEAHRAALSAEQEKTAAREAELAALQEAYEALKERTRLLEARNKGERILAGDVPAEETQGYTDKEDFDELEKEYAAFTRYYNTAWKQTKRGIRREVLSLRRIMGKDKGTEGDA